MSENEQDLVVTTEIFRKEALDELAAPEQLDQVLKVTSPLGWLALATAMLLIAGLFAWGIIGTYRTTVSGIGILVRVDGAFVDVYAPRPGWIESFADTGEKVAKGALIARLVSPEDRARIDDLEARIAQLKEHRGSIDSRHAERIEKETLAAEQRRAALQETIDIGQSRIQALTDTLEVREDLRIKGLTTTDRVMEARELLFSAQQSVSRAKADMLASDASLLTLLSRRDEELESIDRQMRDNEGQLGQLRLAESLSTEIHAPVEGEVVMDVVNIHALVSAGQKLMVIEAGEPRLEALLYVPAESGKEVKEGMEVRLSPSIARKEEYGMLVGRVIRANPVPESEAAIAGRLSNPDLGRLFTSAGPPIQLLIELDEGPSGPTSYAWSSERGQSVPLTSGTLLTGQVTVRTGRPIELFVPALKRWFGF